MNHFLYIYLSLLLINTVTSPGMQMLLLFLECNKYLRLENNTSSLSGHISVNANRVSYPKAAPFSKHCNGGISLFSGAGIIHKKRYNC